jgi:Caspase domain
MIKYLRVLFLLIASLIGSLTTGYAQKNAQYPWNPVLLDKSKKDVARRVIQNKQGQFVVVGTTHNWLLGNNDDAFFTIVDSIGVQQLNAMPIGSRQNTEGANSVLQTRDGGYVIVGFSDSSATDYQAKRQGWAVKVSERGLQIWSKRIETLKSGEFTDVAEAPNGDLWLTGEMGGKLWMTRLDQTGKLIKIISLSGNAEYSRGNALAWARDGQRLMVVGTVVERYPVGQSNLLIAPFDTKIEDFITEKPYYKAEGNGIVRDGKGNFGIVGTSYASKEGGDILFAYADSNGFITHTKTFGDAYTNDQGFGIAEDLDGNFIVVGEAFEDRQKNKTQAWVQKLTPDGTIFGKPFEAKGKFLGSIGDDLFKAVIVSERGVPIIVGKTYSLKKLEADGWLLPLPPSVSPQNAALPDLKVTPGRFYDDEDNPIFRRGKRGFYSFTIENRDTNDVFELVAKVIQTKGEQKITKEYEHIHIGTLRSGEQRTVTIPFVKEDNLLRDEWDFTVQFFAKKRPLSINHNFHVSTRDMMRHKLVPSSTFPTDIQAGKTYNYTFTLMNEGELVAKNVQLFIDPKTGSRIKLIGKERVKVGDIGVGETRTIDLSFETDKDYISPVLLLPIFVRVNEEETIGNKVELTSRLSHPKPEPRVMDTVRYVKPMQLDWQNTDGKDTVVTTQSSDTLELVIHAQTELRKKEDIKFYINGLENAGEKFDNVSMESIGSTTTHRFNYLMTFEVSVPIGFSPIQVVVKDGKNFQQTQLVVKRVNPPNLYLLAVGVDYSENDLDNLSYTGADAVSLDSIFNKTQKRKLFDKVNSRVLKNAYETTGENIKQELAKMVNNCTKNDVLMVLFSGHGQITDAKGDTIWFLGSDYDKAKRETYLEYNQDIKQVLDGAKGQKILFLDACQKRKKDKSGATDPSQLSGAIAQLIQATPTFRALLSCSANQSSWETPTYGHGAFTQAILEALGNKTVSCGNGYCNANATKAGFAKPDRVLTFRELVRFVKKRVPAIIEEMGRKSTQQQTPTERDNDLPEDIPIFWLDN